MGGQRKVYGENKRGGEMKRSVSIYLRRDDCGSCGRWLSVKINIWMQNRKCNIQSTQLREIQKRRSLIVFKTKKKISFMSPNKCKKKIRM